MPEYVTKEAVKQAMRSQPRGILFTEWELDQVPTVDAVEVVRCRDCKHLVLTAEGEHNPCDCVCDYWMSDGLNDNDFCSYGERKDGDD